MIKTKVKITGLDRMLRTHPKAVDGLKVIAKDLALETAAAQELAIISGAAPDGSAQMQTSAKTEAIKVKARVKHVQPLYRTGVLSDARRWKTSKTKRGANLTAPKERTAAVIALQARGFKTVLNTPLPESVMDSAEVKLDKLAKELSR